MYVDEKLTNLTVNSPEAVLHVSDFLVNDGQNVKTFASSSRETKIILWKNHRLPKINTRDFFSELEGI